MPEVYKIILAVLSGVLLHWLKQKFDPSAKLVWAVSNHFAWGTNPAANVITLTRHILIANGGRAAAENVELTLAFRPMHLQFHPPRNVSEQPVQHAHVIQLGTLAPKEQVDVAMMMVGPSEQANLPMVTSVRSRTSVGKQVEVTPTRVFPPWIRGIIGALVIIGFVAVMYGVFRFIDSSLHAFGFV